MGYNTNYSLTIIEDGHQNDDINYKVEIKNLTDYIDLFSEQIKWYKHQNDMLKLSKKYPKTTFLLEGQGDGSDDIWREYYKDNKMLRQIAEITFPPYLEINLE